MDNLQLRQLIEAHGGEIFTFFIHLTGNRNRAEELYQDTFLKAIQLDKIDFDNNPKSYLLGIGIHIWQNKKRKEYFRSLKVQSTLLSQVENIFELVDDTSLQNDIEQKEINRRVRAAVYKMPDKYKSVTLLYYMQDMSTAEISRTLGIPKGTVKTRLKKARVILKKELEDFI